MARQGVEMIFALASALTLAFWTALAGNFRGFRTALFANSVIRSVLLVPVLLMLNLLFFNLAIGVDFSSQSNTRIARTPVSTESAAMAAGPSAPAATAAPTPTPRPPLRDQLQTLWAKSQWISVIILLEGAKGGPEWSDDLSEKLYAANVNAGQDQLKARRYELAETYFSSALAVNPNGSEAQIGLAEAKKVAARQGALLELLPGGGCTKSYSFITYEGRVRNISGKSLRNVMAVASYFTKDGTFVKTADALIDFNPVLDGQISPFKTITTDNPAIQRCSVEFKELLGSKIPHYQEP